MKKVRTWTKLKQCSIVCDKNLNLKISKMWLKLKLRLAKIRNLKFGPQALIVCQPLPYTFGRLIIYLYFLIVFHFYYLIFFVLLLFFFLTINVTINPNPRFAIIFLIILVNFYLFIFVFFCIILNLLLSPFTPTLGKYFLSLFILLLINL